MLGRDPSCEVLLDSPKVSRHHCCLAESNGLILVRDLGSTNGTRVNGRGVKMGWLVHGDILSVAHIRFQLLRLPGADLWDRARPIGR
jgi:pSer/pThr/pTyr-binding forkhead associated (FHA) protein